MKLHIASLLLLPIALLAQSEPYIPGRGIPGTKPFEPYIPGRGISGAKPSKPYIPGRGIPGTKPSEPYVSDREPAAIPSDPIPTGPRLVRLGWRCKFKSFLHTSPEECDHPEEGGEWVYGPEPKLSGYEKSQKLIGVAEEAASKLKESGEKLPCTTFVQNVLQRSGIYLSQKDRVQLQMSNIAPDKFDKAVGSYSKALRGSVGVLIDRGLAKEVDIADVAPGDVVQYWRRNADAPGGYTGHTAIISKSLGGGRVRLIESDVNNGARTGRVEDLNAKQNVWLGRLK